MRVAVFHSLPSGGARRALVEMAKQLVALGVELDLFATSSADEELLPSAIPGVKVRVWPTRLWQGFGATSRLRRATQVIPLVAALRAEERVQAQIAGEIDRGSYDVAFVHHDRLLHAPAVLRHLQLPSVYYCQEPLRAAYEYELAPGSILERTLMHAPRVGLRDRDAASTRAADRVLANSFFSRESIRRAYGVDAAVVYLGVDTQSFSPGVARRENFVLSAGALHPQKGHREAVRTVACIPATRRPRLVVVGDRGVPGEADRLRELADDLSVHLTIASRVAEPQLVDLYRTAKLLLCFQSLEPFGLVALEAAATGTPTVGVREGGLREAIVDGETGLLSNSRDPAVLAALVEELLSDDKRWSALSESAVETVRRGWSWRHTGERLHHHLDALRRSQARLGG